MRMHPAVTIALAVSIITMALGATDSQAADPSPTAFLKQHCVRCHSGKTPKGDLALDALAFPKTAGPDVETWARLLEVIDSGEMPPEGEPRPPAADVRAQVQSLGNALATLQGARPLALRRLSRVEYEYTVQDLLGIDTPLAELLPEDGTVQGFDNVGEGLSFSAILMERYLEAADVAFEGTIRRIKPLPIAARRAVMMEEKENIASVEQKRAGTLRVEDSFVKFSGGWPPVRVDSAHPIEGGIYRCRIAVWPYQAGERTLAVAVYVGPLFGPGKRHSMGMFDVTGTPEDPRIIEFTTRMEEGHALHIVPWISPPWKNGSPDPKPGIAVKWVETNGPLDQEWPAPSQTALFGDTVEMIDGNPIYMRHRKGVKLQIVSSKTPKEDVERIIRDFVPRAFRRPVEAKVVQPYVDLALARLEAGRTFEQAVRAGVCAVLCSPQFLLINDEGKVDDYALAARLSYFLWSTMPDAELLELAAQGKLRSPAVKHAQVERMLKDPKSARFVQNFTNQWLDLKDIEFTTPDKRLYPEFDELLQASMLGETRGFFAHVLEQNLSILSFIDSDFSVLNERIARHYGIPGVTGHETFRVVPIPEDNVRGGILSQAAVLKVTANGTNSSPVIRGVWVLENFFGQPAPPPPPGVPAVEPDIRGATTIREQLAKHSQTGSCARCHVRIDPPGFALECFDPIGGLRDRYRSLGEGEKVRGANYKLGPKVETDGKFADGRTFADFSAFRAMLLQDPDIFAEALTEKLLVYATGRRVTGAEHVAVESIVAKAKKEKLGFKALIHAIVDSEPFLRP